MPNLLIRNVPPAVVARLKRRAKQHHRSVQAEVLDIVESGSRGSGDEFVTALRQLRAEGKLRIDLRAALRALREDRAR